MLMYYTLPYLNLNINPSRKCLTASLVSLKNNGAINPVINCVTAVAIAAPVIPKIGINIAFKITLEITPIRANHLAYFCFPSHINQNSLTTPTNENVTPNIAICNDTNPGKYSLPYKRMK